jgi:hypothetical protein
MHETEKGYNGWSNYVTWDVAQWIDNDQDLLEYVHKIGRENTDKVLFADAIKYTIEAMAPELEASVFSDLLNFAISEVDWYELAESYLKEIAEIDEYNRR